MSTTIINGITYTVSGLTAYVSSADNDTILPNSVIESSVEIDLSSYPVTYIGDNAFRLPMPPFSPTPRLVSIIIPDSVTSMGSYAFYYCTALTSVTLGNGLTSISTGAFAECRALTSVVIPNSVTSIGSQAFDYCRALTSVVIPNSVTSMGSYAFQFFGGTSLTIPDSVTTIGNGALANCLALTSVTLGNGITSIDIDMFYNCSALNSIIIPNSVTSIGSSAFLQCSSLPSIVIPDSVTSIGLNAFNSCPNLITVTIQKPSIITTVNTNSFTDVSTNPNSSITFYNTASYNDLSSTWQMISAYYFTQIYNPGLPPPTIGTLTIPDKTYGDSPFQITQPTSNSQGAFTYTSSNTSVATISGDIITIVGVGSSLITATQAPYGNYSSGSVNTIFTVNQNTPENPAELTNGSDLEYFLNSSAEYGNLENSVTVNADLIAAVPKVLTSSGYVTIIKI